MELSIKKSFILIIINYARAVIERLKWHSVYDHAKKVNNCEHKYDLCTPNFRMFTPTIKDIYNFMPTV